MAQSADETLTQLTESFWFGIGRSTAAVYASRKEWLFRRVESIEFIGRRSVVRSVSVDFEIPAELPDLGDRAAKGTALVPISVFQKWPPLMGFSFVGPEGHPASLYLRATNKKLDFGLLLGMSDFALALGERRIDRCSRELRRRIARRVRQPRPERLPVELRRELAALVGNARPGQAAVANAANRLKAELERQLEHALESERSRGGSEIATRIAATVDLAAQLAGSSILWVPVVGTQGTDRIVKFSYLDEYRASRLDRPDEADIDEPGKSEIGWRRATEAWWKRFLIACSWRQRTLLIPLPHAGRYTRYHLDIRAPHGSVELVEAQAMAFPPAGDNDGVRDAQVRSVRNLARIYPALDIPDEFVGPDSSRFLMDYGEPTVLANTSSSPDWGREHSPGREREASAQIVDRRAHVYLGARSAPSHRVFLQVKLAATRHGFILGCVMAAITIAVLVSVAYANLKSAALHLEPTVVLLSAVPVVLGYVLVRPGEHALERYHIAGVRAMALVSGAMPILGALTLVLTHKGSAVGSPPDLTWAKPIWRGLLVGTRLTAVGLVLSWLFAAPPKERSEGAGSESRR